MTEPAAGLQLLLDEILFQPNPDHPPLPFVDLFPPCLPPCLVSFAMVCAVPFPEQLQELWEDGGNALQGSARFG